jgi:hypothetical protein
MMKEGVDELARSKDEACNHMRMADAASAAMMSSLQLGPPALANCSRCLG